MMPIGVCYGFGCSFFFSNTNFQNTNKIMTANELRIGNLFYGTLKKHGVKLPIQCAFRVFKIEAFRVKACLWNKHFATTPDNEFYWFDIKDIVGTPLTQNIILNNGFEKTSNFYSFTNDLKFIIEPDIEERFCLRVKLSKYLSVFICQVNFVHQLQNAMFVFREEELFFSSTEP